MITKGIRTRYATQLRQAAPRSAGQRSSPTTCAIPSVTGSWSSMLTVAPSLPDRRDR